MAERPAASRACRDFTLCAVAKTAARRDRGRCTAKSVQRWLPPTTREQGRRKPAGGPQARLCRECQRLETIPSPLPIQQGYATLGSVGRSVRACRIQSPPHSCGTRCGSARHASRTDCSAFIDTPAQLPEEVRHRVQLGRLGRLHHSGCGYGLHVRTGVASGPVPDPAVDGRPACGAAASAGFPAAAAACTCCLRRPLRTAPRSSPAPPVPSQTSPRPPTVLATPVASTSNCNKYNCSTKSVAWTNMKVWAILWGSCPQPAIRAPDHGQRPARDPLFPPAPPAATLRPPRASPGPARERARALAAPDLAGFCNTPRDFLLALSWCNQCASMMCAFNKGGKPHERNELQ